VFALTPTGPIGIFGINDGSGGGTNGRMITIINNNTSTGTTMTFHNREPATSVNLQLFFNGNTNATVAIDYGMAISFVYVVTPPLINNVDMSGNKWVMISHT
jgi:hypothetical protein